MSRCRMLVWGIVLWNLQYGMPVIAQEQAQNVSKEVRDVSRQVAETFGAGKAEDLAKFFLADGEWIDENGVVYAGRDEIQRVLTDYFSRFPGAKMKITPDSVRMVGPVVIEEGVRTITAGTEGEFQAMSRYIVVMARDNQTWRIASLRDFNNEPVPAPHDRLEQLGWLVGEWINEGTDAQVGVVYQWSEDGNYLLGEYTVAHAGEPVMKTTHRIGWDPIQGRLRSWTFDSDGGFADGTWTSADEEWIVKSVAVLPNGISGSATITFHRESEDRFIMTGTDRVVGSNREPDFEVTVVRKLSRPGK